MTIKEETQRRINAANKLRVIANDMLATLCDQPSDLDEGERYLEQVQFLAKGSIPAIIVSEWALKLSKLSDSLADKDSPNT